MDAQTLLDNLKPNERFVASNESALVYSGRINWENPTVPILSYPCSSIRFHLTGRECKLVVRNIHSFWDNYLGVVIGDKQYQIVMPNDEDALIDISSYLHENENEVMIYKRQDACHALVFYGMIVPNDAALHAPSLPPNRRIEVYGDSVSAGEVAEAEAYAGKQDPEHQGQWSDSYDSYAWMTARNLDAQIHDIAQGGIALLDGCGYFNAPNYIGMLSSYDKLNHNPALGKVTDWDFAKYRPHVVVIAIGQNDSHPVNIMADDYQSEASKAWRTGYAELIRRIRHQYPSATIILATTILNHDAAWDRAIDEVWVKMAATDRRLYHFLYSNNGTGTHGHIRTSEAERMSDELSTFIKSLGEEIWQEEVDNDSIS
ncbi:MAG: electron transporter RnfD [Clostridiales bacterium]|nr:electron transporter RnfD [Clostridiales bacterium]